MNYDHRIFEASRALAITDASKLVIGNRYYSNDTGSDGFILTALLTNSEYYRTREMTWESEGGDELGWLMHDRGHKALEDSNIGASYNPWLIFDNQNLNQACIEMLKVTYDNDEDGFYDWFPHGELA